MTKFFFKFKKPYFWPFLAHFPNFEGKKSFPTKSSCYAQLLKGFWHHPKFREIWWSNFKKTLRQMSGAKDEQTLFHRILTATIMGLTNKTALNWHLKVKDTEYNVGLTKNYCITVSMEKSSSIQKLIWQVLGSHELNDNAQTQKSLKLLLAFLNLHQHAKNKFIPSTQSWDRVNFRVLQPGWPHPSLTMPIPKFFDQLLIYVNLSQHVKNQAISLICSGDMVD